MNNQEIVAKLWNLCNVLRDDGITYHQYVTELTYILFLKKWKMHYNFIHMEIDPYQLHMHQYSHILSPDSLLPSGKE